MCVHARSHACWASWSAGRRLTSKGGFCVGCLPVSSDLLPQSLSCGDPAPHCALSPPHQLQLPLPCLPPISSSPLSPVGCHHFLASCPQGGLELSPRRAYVCSAGSRGALTVRVGWPPRAEQPGPKWAGAGHMAVAPKAWPCLADSCKWQQLTPCSSRLAQLGPCGSAGRRWVRVGSQADGAAAFVLAQPQGWREAFGACSRAREASDCILLAEPSHVLQRRHEEGESPRPGLRAPRFWAQSGGQGAESSAEIGASVLSTAAHRQPVPCEV